MTARISIDSENPSTEQSIPERFEKFAKRHPDRLAVKHRDQALSYESLNAAANRVAYGLLHTNGSNIKAAALLFGQGIDVISAILGTLKTGARYCALDAEAPEERIEYILNDFQTDVILTNSLNFDLALRVARRSRTVINIDEIAFENSSGNPGVVIAPDQIAAVVYTSGSTGYPRGVVRTHQRTTTNVASYGVFRELCGDDRISLTHSVSYSSGDADLLMGILNGAAIFPFSVRSEGIPNLAEWLKKERITIFHTAPSAFRELTGLTFPVDHFSDLRLIRLSGAPITQRDFDLYRSKFPARTRLEVGMGSTEAAAICNAMVDQNFSFPREGSPVGYAREGKKIFILDEHGRVLPAGVVGEIAVKSRDFSLGYWRQADLTERKSLRDSDGGDEVTYLTGDLGTMLSDGFVIHLGRKDLAVKIRGYRVDISEVENALLKHPAVKEAGIAAWEREPGEKYLAAYIVANRDSAPTVGDLRKFLSNKLPDYMIPSAFMFLASLPSTNGKLDRLALPKPDTLRPELKETHVAPRDDTERKLAGIWSEVLQIDNIGVHDNFFDLGGHSLTASRVLSRVLDCFRVEVSLSSFFESPTIADLSKDVQDAIRQQHSNPNLPLVQVPRGNNLPVSFGQQALWFQDQLEPGSCAYNLVSSYQLSGELDAQLMEQSINQIIARHEVLRTVFETVDGQPVQKILPTMTIRLEVIDLSHLVSESLQDSEVRHFVGVLAEQSFNLAGGPLLRPALLRLRSNEHAFLLAVHHIVFDGWSTGVFFRELSEIYNRLRSGKPCPFPKLRIQYADFAMWQRQRLCDANLEQHLTYWRNQLNNLSMLKLPFKRSQPAADGSFGARDTFEISGDLLDGLQSLKDRSGTTLFMVLLAAWNVALHRYTGQTDIAIGTFVSGRNHPAVEELIGYFLNLVVLRSDLSGDPTFRELLERIRRVCIDAFAHQELPFEKIVEELRPTRYVTTNPLVQATFALQNTPQQSLNLTGIAARDLDIAAAVARPFDLHLYVIEEETSLRGYVSYNKSLFEIDTIKRLIIHLKNLLKAIATDQDRRISTLPMLAEQEKHQLLVEWNDTNAEYPRDKCIHELFENQVERTPENIAVVFEDQQLTYRELNNRANQLAHYLQKHGVGPDVLVGICMERSVEIVIGMLGVLKAGGAYVPLDPTYPCERLGFMIDDAEMSLLLTQSHLAERLPAGEVERISLSSDWNMFEGESKQNLFRVMAEDLAYVMYTSGSTGKPKGVMIPHKGLVNYLSWAVEAYQVACGRGAPVHSSIGFDLTVTSLFSPLLVGQRVVLLPEDRSVQALMDLVRNEKHFSLIKITPAHLEVLSQQLKPEEAVGCAGAFIIGGEALWGENLAFWCNNAPSTRLINEYGPTETVVGCCVYEVPSGSTPSGAVPIGRPIANTQVYILDAYRNPVPIGVVGEIYIGGDGVARGYLNRPELTNEKFIANPFSADVTSRLYKTGDLARYLPDGNIEFLGRMDNQVKIRGYRIELGEIEAVLGQHRAIREAVVLAREESPGDQRLVAYIVAAPNSTTSTNELRTFLQQKLPEYMIPSVWVSLDRLPLTLNGKIDRGALPAADQSRLESEKSHEAPRTSVEVAVANVWREVLKIDKVSIRDNFFDLGGHSLLATQIVSRIRDRLSAELPLRAIFESPTVAELATLIEKNQSGSLDEAALTRSLGEIEAMTEEEAQQNLLGT